MPHGPPGEQKFCRILHEANWPRFQIIFFLFSYLIPLTLISVLYVCMLVRLWRSSRGSAESRRGRRRVTRLVLVVVGVFVICWCPIQVGRLFSNLFKFNRLKTDGKQAI